jgi:hypothetical protein
MTQYGTRGETGETRASGATLGNPIQCGAATFEDLRNTSGFAFRSSALRLRSDQGNVASAARWRSQPGRILKPERGAVIGDQRGDEISPAGRAPRPRGGAVRQSPADGAASALRAPAPRSAAPAYPSNAAASSAVMGTKVRIRRPASFFAEAPRSLSASPGTTPPLRAWLMRSTPERATVIGQHGGAAGEFRPALDRYVDVGGGNLNSETMPAVSFRRD